MAKSEKKTAEYKIISIRKLSEVSGVPYGKLWGNLSGRVSSLDANEKTVLCNTVYAEMEDLFDFLGFEMKLKRISKKITA